MPATNILEASTKPLVSALSSKDIPVLFENIPTAFVKYDNKTHQPISMHIPIINDDFNAKDLGILRGSVDHECAHLIYTDFESLPAKKNNVIVSFFNALEDPRVEAKISERFLGCRANLDCLVDVCCGNIEQFCQQYTGKSEDITIILMIIARSYWGQSLCKKLIEQYPLLEAVRQYIPFKKEDFVGCKNSKETWELAQKIYDFLMQESKNRNEGSSESSSNDTNGSDSSIDEEGQGESSSQNNNQECKDNTAATEEAKSKSSSSSGDGSVDKIPKIALNDLVEAFDFLKKNTDDVVKQSMEKYQKGHRYTVPTYKMDRIVEVKSLIKNIHVSVNDVFKQSEIDACVNTLKSVLQRKLIAKSREYWTSGYKKGRLNGSSIHKLFMNDNRIFAQKTHCQSKSVAVSLLIDCSGSMYGKPITTAFLTAYVMASVFSAIDIKFEILGYTTIHDYLDESRRNGVYSRNSPLLTYVFKSFDEPLNAEITKRFSHVIGSNSLCNNVDGESLMIGYNRLKVRKEDRKILMVFSDGFPQCPGDVADQKNHLFDVCKFIESKIELIGFGICNSSVKDYYANHINVETIEDIKTTVVKKLSDLLL